MCVPRDRGGRPCLFSCRANELGCGRRNPSYQEQKRGARAAGRQQGEPRSPVVSRAVDSRVRFDKNKIGLDAHAPQQQQWCDGEVGVTRRHLTPNAKKTPECQWCKLTMPRVGVDANRSGGWGVSAVRDGAPQSICQPRCAKGADSSRLSRVRNVCHVDGSRVRKAAAGARSDRASIRLAQQHGVRPDNGTTGH